MDKEIVPILDRTGIPTIDIGLFPTPCDYSYGVVEIYAAAEHIKALREAFGAMVLPRLDVNSLAIMTP